jgi:hypothetical protein
LAENEQLNKNEMYDYRMDYFYEIKRIKAAIESLKNRNDIENDMEAPKKLRCLEDELSNIIKTVDLMASYIAGNSYYHFIVSKDSLNHLYEQKRYLDYVCELRKLNDYQKIGIMCLNLTPAERKRFIDQYNQLKQEELNNERVR